MDSKISFKIRLEGHVDRYWLDWFCHGDGNRPSEMIHCAHGETIIRGEVPDQSAFYGMLTRISDLGLTVKSVVALRNGEHDEELSKSR